MQKRNRSTKSKKTKAPEFNLREKQRKQEEAQARHEKYNSLSLIEKLALLDSRPGESKKERAKLQKKAQITEEKPKEVVKASKEARQAAKYQNKKR